MEGNNHVLCITTVANREDAITIANAVVKARVAACANIVPGITSIYRWKGEIHEDPEYMVFMKTRSALFSRLEAEIRELHPYECPEIVAIPIVGGYEPYLKWIDENTG